MKPTHLLLAALAVAVAFPVFAADPTPEQKSAKEAEDRLHTDWAWVGRYRDANAALPAPVAGQPRIVLIGDSITQGWFDHIPTFFTPGRIGRGIGGQTTPQMLVRFPADVIALKPAVVQIMAGTNDIAFNTGPMTPDESKANIRAMTELAQANGIRVILASIPPADRYPWRPGLDTGSKIVAMNAWLKSYAAATGSTYADYWSALVAPGTLGMREGLSSDHVHPTVAGYAVMAPVAERAFKAALSHPAPTRAMIAR
ncbi:GDSL-type esterase/lipase family protein [Sphingomonas sp. PP-CE-1G-424]|uniref:GDSL-type esterase/lipase family protein n=1 Tax=Sphingomonas sp. PP-CE-1G-424 TaxID=2135658 RepID=UPI00105457C1|nr:GDSL-type esterase/lipase family protein [Sphingomonas sp. PP-CE-1G-424]TCP71303.1 lysophospholipase L1-like esterase [Sphingomonas sp. PP-CE-1G-424]